jgi:uncharacterized protein (DUF58 family)
MNYKAAIRGYYRLGPARLASGDVFGFFPVERDDNTVDPIIVYPSCSTCRRWGCRRTARSAK